MNIPVKSYKKTSSNNPNSGKSKYWKPGTRKSTNIITRLCKKINQLVINEDYKASNMDVSYVQLNNGIMYGKVVTGYNHGKAVRRPVRSVNNGNYWEFI